MKSHSIFVSMWIGIITVLVIPLSHWVKDKPTFFLRLAVFTLLISFLSICVEVGYLDTGRSNWYIVPVRIILYFAFILTVILGFLPWDILSIIY